MIRVYLAFLFLSISLFAKAQEYFPKYKSYDWESNPKLHTLSAKEQAFEELVLREKQAVEFVFEGKDNFVEYMLFHKVTRVNTSTAIENNNRIYIPNYVGGQFILHKARVINPKGKVLTLSEKDIKEAVEEDSKVTYKFFALEGLEVGSEIEHLYLIKRAPRYTGVKETFQSQFYKKNIEFELIAPPNLKFQAKSYNGFPEMTKDKTESTRNVLYVHVDSIPALKEEKESAWRSNLQSVIYKIASSNANNEIVSFGKVSENIYKNMMTFEDAGVIKKLNKVISQIDLKSSKDDESKIKIIENYVKANYSVIDASNKGLDDLEYIIEKKSANEEGIVKFFSAIFKQLKIDYQIVLTCNRENLKFDPDFEAYLFLTDYLIYFPGIDQYIEPAHRFNRLGFVNPNYTHNHGLFVKEIDLGNYKTGIGKVRFIDAPTFDKTAHNLEIDVNFDEDLSTSEVKIKNTMTGYYALYFQPYYSFYSEDEKTKVNTKIMESYFPQMHIANLKVENAGQEYVGKSPFIMTVDVKDENLIQKAGGKYLFKIGETIGVQMEMYQKEERKTEVESNFNRTFLRKITINIPKGYKIMNPEILNMDYYQEENGERITTFTSKYNLTPTSCVIDINEYYKKITTSKKDFESYRKVVNAAADFNKLILVLQKI
jgi:hypothetical protein